MEKKTKLPTQKGQQVMNLSEDEARAYFEKQRWAGEPYCPHCGSINAYRLQGKSQRPGLFECRDCKLNFTVTVGTVMEDTHLPLATWAKAFHLMASSKKGISALQLQRNLGLGSYKTAWHLAHRIRLAMKIERPSAKLKGDVQVDETYIGANRRSKTWDGVQRRRGRGTTKIPVMALVETGGDVRTQTLTGYDIQTVRKVITEHVDKSSRIITDEMSSYPRAVADYQGGHRTVNHKAGEYADAEGFNTNTAESFFALLKRGIHGSFHHVSKQHLHRYCDEFCFRWNGRKLEDTARRDAAVRGSEGKRLMFYQPTTNA
jgi:transposase-like protein